MRVLVQVGGNIPQLLLFGKLFVAGTIQVNSRSKKEPGMWSAITDVNVRATDAKPLPGLEAARRALRCQPDRRLVVGVPLT